MPIYCPALTIQPTGLTLQATQCHIYRIHASVHFIFIGSYELYKVHSSGTLHYDFYALQTDI